MQNHNAAALTQTFGNSPASAQEQALPADAVPGFTLLRLLGRGGMGQVYLAEQHMPKRLVALKTLTSAFAGADMLRRFFDEASYLARLKHPGIAQLFDFGRITLSMGDLPYYTLEYVDGPTLRAYQEASSLSALQIVQLISALADAVHHAHIKGIVHRDIKPENVLIDALGQPKLLDFGIARALDPSDPAAHRSTRGGQLLGTFDYMSPEQLRGDIEQIDSRSDIYSLGAMLYELLAGALPRPAATGDVLASAAALTNAVIRPLRLANGAVAQDLEAIAMKALETDPARRYASAAEFAEDLRRFTRREPVLAREPTFGYMLTAQIRRHRARFLAIGATAVLLLATASIAVVFAISAQKQAALARAQSTLLLGMLAAADASRAKGRQLTALEMAEQAQLALEEHLAKLDMPAVEGEVRAALADVFYGLNELPPALAQYKKAVAALDRSDQRDSDMAMRTRRFLGNAQLRSGDFDAAMVTLDTGIAMASDARGAEALAMRESRAVLLMRQLRYAEAEQELSELEPLLAQATVPDLDRLNDVRFRQGGLWAIQGRFEAARTQLLATEAFERASGEGESFFYYGMLIRRADLERDRGNHQEAGTLMWQALQGREKLFGPDNPRTLLAAAQLVRIGADAGATAHATKLLLDHQKTAAPTADGHLAYAIIARNRGDNATAIAELRKGLAIDSTDSLMAVVLNEQLGAMLLAAGDATAGEYIQASHVQAMRYYGPNHPRFLTAKTALGR